MGSGFAISERLAGAFRRYGIGAIRLIPKNVWNAISYFAPSRRRVRRSLAEFDRRFGVDTAGSRPVGSLRVPAAISAHAAQYQTAGELNVYLQGLVIDHAQYTFVDYGCGKGRILLMASEYPFKEIIGVEYSAELVTIARSNVASFYSPTQLCASISVVECDAGVFDPPNAPGVFFLYNPFDTSILKQVLTRIRKIHAPRKFPHYLIYVDPQHRSCIDTRDDWEIFTDRRTWAVYRSGALSRRRTVI